MTEIKSKIHNYGDEKESQWPSQFGTGAKGVYHVDPETGELKEGYPECKNLNFGTAPTIIFDSMPATYHEKACRVVESRKEWETLDREYGCLTFGSKKDATPKIDEAFEKRKRKAELRQASKTALDVYRANPREVEQRMQKQAEEQETTLRKSGIKKQLVKAIKG